MLPLRLHAAASELGVTPGNLPYGKVAVGKTRTLHVTVTNKGKSSVRISGVHSSNGDFTVAKMTLPQTLTVGAKLTLSVTYSPVAAGWEGGHITVVSNAANHSLNLTVAGTGVATEVTASPASLSFGKVNVGQSASLPLVLTNAHNGRVTLQSMSVRGTGFSVSGAKFPLTLTAGQTVHLRATFKPNAAGTTDGSLSISGPSLHIPLAGTGVAVQTKGQLTMTPGSLSFGTVNVGSNATLPLQVSASGSSVTISSVSSSSSQFAVSGVSLPLTIQAGASSSLNVTFTPPSSGNKSATLTFSSNASNSSASEALSGTGATAAQHSVTLSWSASTSKVTGYNIYRSTSSNGSYVKLNSSLDANTTYTDTTVASGNTYFYATTAVNSGGEESGYSNQVQVAVP